MTAAQSPFGAFHPANAVTYASLLAGMAAIAAALTGHSSAAGAFIAVSVIADTFDGRFARLFTRSDEERAFGAQLDSLSDAIAFGAVPAVTMLLLAPRADAALLALWLGAAFAFATCTITRLAFFNVTHEWSGGFVGVPAPVGALIWATVLLLEPSPLASSIVLLITAGAMVSPFRISRPTGLGFAAFVLWPLAVVAAHLL